MEVRTAKKMDCVLDDLKARTRELHERVERRLDLPARLESVWEFAEILKAFWGFYGPLEAKLAEVLNSRSVALDFGARRKAELIAADLRRLDVAVETLPLCDDLPEIGSAAAALGCMYVLEGATLGGQIIRRLLEEKLSIAPDSGGSFFSAYGDRVGAMWKEYRGAVSEYAHAHPNEREAILAAAMETFTKLDRWLEERLPRITRDS